MILPKLNEKDINTFIGILAILSSFFFIVSLFFFFSALTTLSFGYDGSFNGCVKRIYDAVSYYSGLYQFTLVIIGLYVTLTRLELSLDARDKTETREQNRISREEDKESKAIKTETLNYCFKYSDEIQKDYAEFTGLIPSGYNFQWLELEKLTYEELKDVYPDQESNYIKKLNSKSKKETLILLYKLDAFSALLLKGNLDKDLSKDIIGKTFIYQVQMLFGIIAYYRPERNRDFCINTITLYNEWSDTPIKPN